MNYRKYMERKISTTWREEKEELYDVIAALADTIRSLTNEIVELQGIILQQSSTRKLLPGQTKLGVVY